MVLNSVQFCWTPIDSPSSWLSIRSDFVIIAVIDRLLERVSEPDLWEKSCFISEKKSYLGDFSFSAVLLHINRFFIILAIDLNWFHPHSFHRTDVGAKNRARPLGKWLKTSFWQLWLPKKNRIATIFYSVQFCYTPVHLLASWLSIGGGFIIPAFIERPLERINGPDLRSEGRRARNFWRSFHWPLSHLYVMLSIS